MSEDSVPHLAREIIAERAAKKDIISFAEYFLGLDVPQHHREAYQLYEALEGGTWSAEWVCPVGHGKSTVWAYAVPLWEICNDRDARILMAAKNDAMAANAARRIRHELESNEKLLRAYGKFETEIWSETKFQVSRPSNLKDPTLTVTGLGGGIEGVRLTLAILDDVIDITSMTSEAERRRAIEWYAHTLRPRMEPQGRVLVVGTPWHPDDLYAALHTSPAFKQLRHEAIKQDGQPLWPSRFSLSRLTEIRADVGELAFKQKFLCSPQAITGNLLKAEWLHYWDPAADPPDVEDLEIRMGVDPAISQKDSADDSAIVTCGYDRSGRKVYEMDTWAEKVDFPELLQMIIRKAEYWHPTKIMVEENAYQASIRQALAKTSNLPIVGVKTHKDKVTRMLALSPHFEAGRLLLKRTNIKLVSQYLDFPHGRHDDTLDALELCVHDWLSTGSGNYGPVEVDWGELLR